MLIALAFAHSLNWSILAKFAKKIQRNRLFFTDCFLAFSEFWLFSHENLAKSADFSTNFDFFPAKIPRNRPIFLRILTFFPRKSREIGRFFREFAPENSAKFYFFFRKISEALLNIHSKYISINDSGAPNDQMFLNMSEVSPMIFIML